jgi:hypothetical protein
MLKSRRGFLRHFGVGVAGAAGLLLPGAAQAGWRRRGGVICCPPPDFCPPPVVCEQIVRPAYPYGPVICSFPDPAVPQLKGNGLFFSWGSTVMGSRCFVDSLQLVNGDGTGSPAPTVVGGATAVLLSAAKTNPWYFQCSAPINTQFYLKFMFLGPDNMVHPIDPPYPGAFICIGY